MRLSAFEEQKQIQRLEESQQRLGAALGGFKGLLGLEGNGSVSTLGLPETVSETRAPMGGDPKKR